VGTYGSKQYLFKYNSSGSTIWHKEWGGNCRSGNIKVTLKDNIMISNITYYSNNGSVDIWITKINGSGIIINNTKIGNYFGWGRLDAFWGDIGYFDDFDNVYFILRSSHDYDLYLLKINSNLTITWNYSINNYPISSSGYLSTEIKCDSQQNIILFSRGSIYRTKKLRFVKLNSSGKTIDTFSWGGSNNIEYIRGSMDTQDNFYFICLSEVLSRWNEHLYYTILVKNPQPNGFPPELDLGIDERDILVFNFMIIVSIISIGIMLSIVIPKLKIFNRNKYIR
ncbi:MAG: hypothetical protein ACFFE4_20320, partial [Candidatus Thorarchaeota archaeon]